MVAQLSEKAQTALVSLSPQVELDPLTQGDYERIKGALKSLRDILLCMTLRATGLRISEVIRVQVEQMEREGPVVTLLVYRGKKGNKTHWERVYLPPQLGTLLWGYVKGNDMNPGERIFKLQRRAVGYIFAKAGRTAIGRPVHPHEFRGLYTKTLIDGGLPVEAAAKMLGHSDIRTTMKHYYDLTQAQREEIQRRIPV